MKQLDKFYIPLANLGFQPVKQGDLLYQEGPLLSHFTAKESIHEHYLYSWVDDDEKSQSLVNF